MPDHQLSAGKRKAHRILSLFGVLCCFAALPQLARADKCQPGPIDPSVTVCTPTSNQTVPTPTHVVAATTDSHPVVAVQIYVDDKLVYQVNADSVDTYIPLAIGRHLLTVQAKDDTGNTFKTEVPVSMKPPCELNPTNQTITICSPGKGATLSLPVHLNAGTTDKSPVQTIQVFADGNLINQTNSQTLDVYLSSLSTGKHNLKLTATDLNGSFFSKSISIRVTASKGLDKLRHIIFFVQENRSFDNYFGMLGKYRVSKGLPNDIDGVPLNKVLYDRQGNPVKPYHFQTVCHENLSPFWNADHRDLNGGKMNRFMKTSLPSDIDPTGTRAMGYYDWTDLPYYYELATQFATSDRFFAPVLTATIPNRMYLFAGTSFGHIRPDSPPPGGWTQPTIFDALDKAGVSWRYYYQDNSVFLAQWSTWQRDSGKVYPISYWYSDIQDESTLPQVLFIERATATRLDEHPGNNIQLGAANTKKILDALMTSPSWASSAFIFSFDEFGGLFDHVVPATMIPPDDIPPMLEPGDLYGEFSYDGFRIPMIVVSPWVKPNYVSHTWRDLTSILRLIEVRFNVPPLTARDASADDMMEFFDFSTPHWLNPPPLPDQPTDGVCDFKKEKAPGF